MAIYSQPQLISASNATYVTNTSGSITAANVRGLNTNWISSSALLSGSNLFRGNQSISSSKYLDFNSQGLTLWADSLRGNITSSNGLYIINGYVGGAASEFYIQQVGSVYPIIIENTDGNIELTANSSNKGIQILGDFNTIQGQTEFLSQVSISSSADYDLNVTGSIKASDIITTTGNLVLPNLSAGSTETDILVWNNNGTIYKRSNLSLQGAQGIQGIQGLQGVQGTSGTNGSQGIQGIQGTSGTNGSQGIQGIQGIQGTKGTDGTNGSQGVQGIQGIQGITGTGSQGTQGIQGVQGTTGTGSQGTQGIQGVQGTTGSGSQGTQGIQGVQGTTGSGSQGTQGIQGPSGSGSQGTQGIQGIQGTSGTNGTGTQGTQGPQGPSGAGASITNNTDNYVLTATGGSSINGEANMTFNGSVLAVTGDIHATGDVAAYYSDKRLKDNIVTIDNPLDKLDKLNGYYYTQSKLAEEFGYNDYSRQVGVIAQEVEEVLPEAIGIAPFDNDGNGNSKSGENYLTVKYEKIIPLLIQAVKELQAEIKELKNK